MQKHGGEARVLAGGQSHIPAMRFRLARPAVLVDINLIKELDFVKMDGALTLGALTRDVAIERAPWITERRWSLLRDVAAVVADPAYGRQPPSSAVCVTTIRPATGRRWRSRRARRSTCVGRADRDR